MITFLDGPAAGQRLNLARTPLLLRVVRCTVSGRWDALDQLSDSPASFEEIHVYRLTRPPQVVHIDYRDKQGRRRGDWHKTTEYRLLDEQPTDDEMRDNEAWTAWCHAWAERNLNKETQK